MVILRVLNTLQARRSQDNDQFQALSSPWIQSQILLTLKNQTPINAKKKKVFHQSLVFIYLFRLALITQFISNRIQAMPEQTWLIGM